MNRHLRRLMALLVGLNVSVVMAQASPATAPPPAAVTGDVTPTLTTQDLSAFFDGLMPFTLRRNDIAGGVVVVVKDGAVLFAKGYGYADLAQRTPVSPQTTLFRPGSTSKLFTWTAVMQLVEQGKLNLDQDINHYLDFKIPPYEGKPITLRNVMTHTPGFEDSARDLLPASIADVDLERYLKAHVPARIYPPGEVVAYSNYGCGLAGYIVQRVSGERFDDYIVQHIFKPLDMAHSSFAQPLPASLAPLLAKGYKVASDGIARPFELVNPPPAGALSSSAMDMARFMIAQLQDGRYGDARILQASTAELMHSPHYRPAPGLNGFDLGFFQEDRNGLHIIGHGGDTVFFHSDLHLLLDKGVGIFMSFNSAGSRDAGGIRMVRAAIFHDFLDRYFPYSVTADPTWHSAKNDAARVVGWYQATRRNESALRMLYLMGQTSITSQPDGTLTVSMLTDDAGQPLHWREVGPLQYREVHGQDKLDFVTNSDGSIRYWATDYIPAIEIFQRMSTLKSLGSVSPLVAVALVSALMTLVIWLAGGLIRRHYHVPLNVPAELHRTRLLSRWGALVLFVDLLGWMVLIVATGVNENLLLQGTAAPWMGLLYAVGVIALLGVVAIAVHMVRCWLTARSWPVRVGETLLALAAIYLGWFILAFGLVSFNTHF